MSEYFADYPLPADVVVPVPLHRKRLRQRGYNQSCLLARELSKLTGLPLNGNGLYRQHYAPPQTTTHSVADRQRNVTGAFICPNTSVINQQVLLIDDVSTSGATLDACAAALKTAGATAVWGLVLAKEV